MLPELETRRFLLREVSLEDGPALQAFQNRREQWLYQAVEPLEFSDGTLRVRRYLEHRGPDAERRLFVCVALQKSSGAIIGQASLSRSHPAIASLGFGVAGEHFGKGYATEISGRLIAFGFEDVGLHRICADVAVENKQCIRVLEKIGMTREGVARDCIWAQGKWWTEAQYSILENELPRQNLQDAARQADLQSSRQM